MTFSCQEGVGEGAILGAHADWFKSIVEAWDGLLYVGTSDFRIRYLNPNFIELLGRDARGEYCYRALHGRKEPCPWCPEEVFQGKTVRGRFQEPRNGLWYDVQNSPLPLGDGTFAKVAFIRESADPENPVKQLPVYRKLLDHLSDATFLLSLEDGRVLYANDRACRNLGYSREELLIKTADAFCEAITTPEEWPELVSQIETEGCVLFETRHRRIDGSSFPVEVNATVVHAGLRPVILSVVRDITERKRTENRLIEERNKVEAIIAAMGEGITVQDRNFRIIYQNDVLVQRVGSRIGEVCHQAYMDRDRVCEDCPLEKCMADGQIHRGEFLVDRNGERFQREITACPLRDADGKVVGFVEVVRDITEQKRMERELRESNKKYRLLFSAESDAILTYDAGSGEIHEVNDTACRLYGLTREEFAGRLWPDLVMETGEEVSGRLRSALHRRGDGTVFPVEYSSGDFHWQGKLMRVEIVRDITERRRLEKCREEVFSVVSHEMRTPLTAINGFAEFLLENETTPEAQRQFLGRIGKEGARLHCLIDNLLSFQRLRAGFGLEAPGPVSVPALLEEVVESFHSPSTKQRLEIACAPEHPPVFGDEEKLRRALQNLLGNAVKFSPAGSTIRLGAQVVGSSCRFWVRDEGPGIPLAEQEKIFERFYRLGTPQGPGGTGLGLALVREIAQAHGGRAWVESALGEGAVFYLSLPLAAAEDEETPGPD